MSELSYSRDFVRDLKDENQAMSRICDKWEREYATLKAENQRLRDALEPERLARTFHEIYERLAPDFGYETRRDSAVPWDEVPERNRSLMLAVARVIAREALAGDAE